MLKPLLLLFSLLPFCSASAEQKGALRMRDLFASMPDSLLPLLSTNNRLDCLDFIENNMEAKVRNLVDDFSELKRLTSDYLLLEQSQQSRVEMKMIASSDSTAHIVVSATVFGPVADSEVRIYDERWRLLSAVPRPSVAAFFDRVTDEMEQQNILAQLRDLPLLDARLSPEEPTITWTLSLDVLEKKDRALVSPHLRPVRSALSAIAPLP
ncbi:MAG: DUF3256 family protein [Bacteroidales bacterium]|nr:DUF3256 family protein [Candidatus Physcousia equi]